VVFKPAPQVLACESSSALFVLLLADSVASLSNSKLTLCHCEIETKQRSAMDHSFAGFVLPVGGPLVDR
jgi:hypothetical protein